MEPAAPAPDRSSTRIIIELDAVDPPSGQVRREDDPGVHFDGWLGLLRGLSVAFGTRTATVTDGDDT